MQKIIQSQHAQETPELKGASKQNNFTLSYSFGISCRQQVADDAGAPWREWQVRKV